MIQSRLFDFLDAVGGLHPPDTVEERMRAMQVICRVKLRLPANAPNRLGFDLNVIGIRDFGLTYSQVGRCLARAKEEMGLLARMRS